MIKYGKHIIFLIFLISIIACKSQNATSNKNQFVIKVKAIKSELVLPTCIEADPYAVVIEFEVVEAKYKKLYGKKLYAISYCYDYPGDGVFNGELCDLKISTERPYRKEVIIINEELLKKNKTTNKLWITDLSRKVLNYCGPRI